jgi:hypothetical protein
MSMCFRLSKPYRIAFLLLLVAFSLEMNISMGQEISSTNRYFGMVVHASESLDQLQKGRIGTLRVWDAKVGWPHIEPQPGVWAFEKLDRFVMWAEREGVDVIYTLGLTSRWASSRPNEPSGYEPGFAAEPMSMNDWRVYVRKVAERYKGRIKYYEVWNEPSVKHYYTGSVELLTQMASVARDEIKRADSDAKIIGPNVVGRGGHMRYLDQLLSAGYGKYVDIFGHHFYVGQDEPEAMAVTISEVRSVMKKHGLDHLPLWNTETGWWIGNTDGTIENYSEKYGGQPVDPETRGAAHVFRALVLARSLGVDRYIWYSWDHLRGLALRNPVRKNEKPVMAGWRAAQNLMSSYDVLPCRRSKDVWECELRERETGIISWLVWTSKGVKEWRMPAYMDASKYTGFIEKNVDYIKDRTVIIGMQPIYLQK